MVFNVDFLLFFQISRADWSFAACRSFSCFVLKLPFDLLLMKFTDSFDHIYLWGTHIQYNFNVISVWGLFESTYWSKEAFGYFSVKITFFLFSRILCLEPLSAFLLIQVSTWNKNCLCSDRLCWILVFNSVQARGF